jgi:hypothetical protein
MKPHPAVVILLLLVALSSLAGGGDGPVVHDPAIHAGAGLKKELIAGITEADFLKLGDQPRTVKVTLIPSFTDANSGMNFNGYSHGQATYRIPVGWSVEVTFINPSPVPHSAVLVEREMLKKVQMGEPAFSGASTPSPVTGTSTSKTAFSFTASTPGSYALACGIPTHASAGHWVAMEVSATLAVPTLTLGDRPPREAK